MVKIGLFKANDSSIPLDEHLATFRGNGYSLKDKNQAKTDKIEHEIGKSMKKSKSQDEAESEEILNGSTRTHLMGQSLRTNMVSPYPLTPLTPLPQLNKQYPIPFPANFTIHHPCRFPHLDPCSNKQNPSTPPHKTPNPPWQSHESLLVNEQGKESRVQNDWLGEQDKWMA
ncbi:hypothetical protein Tco_1180171 [Tanacetum coccineum]